MNYNPAIFKTRTRPPYNVPSEQTSSWTKKEVRFYQNWQGGGKSLTREDYRQFLIDRNTEFDMEDAFSKIESGLQAFETLVACTKQFPNYNLNKDTEEMYVDKEFTIYKDFIKFGVNFIKNYEVKDNETEEKLSVENGEHPMENLIKSEVKVEENDTTWVETNQVDSCMAMKDTTMDDLSQVTRLDTITPHTTTRSENEDKEDKPKHRRKKERRKKRLLKFQEKLVKTSGLPYSRLMEREILIGKNLASDFEQLAGGGAEFAHGPFPDTRSVPETGTSSPPVPPPMMPAVLMPGQTCGVQPHPPAAPPGCGQPLGLMAGTTSGSNLHSSLSPIHQSFTGTTSGTVRWSEARPMEGSSGNGNTIPTPGPVNWSTSGSLNLPALSPFSPPSAWSAILPPYQPQPVPQVVTPAYCFHCMQYGAVFTIIPA